MPELNFFHSGRDILLSFNKDVGHLLSKANLCSDALLIEKAALLFRREMLKCKSTFQGNFQEDFTKNCVPDQLLQFIESRLTGVKIGVEETKPSKEETALAHLFQFNCNLTYKKDV